ncbi:MAG: DUF192 domain-containing protein [Candidatus Aminicenantes bacterium]|nr:DUF192 domain-containing protein [Candidatus Aminicenantes bacterium]
MSFQRVDLSSTGRAVFLLILAVLLRADGPRPPVKVFFPDGSAVTAELAVTDAERQLGLMHRARLNSDQGMLFIFEEESPHSFWMKNVRFSIDILWLDRDKRIVHIASRVPPCLKDPCPSYPSPLPALYVLEIECGGAEARRLKLHDRLEFILPKDLR